MTLKVTYFINWGAAGWSESQYLAPNTIGGVQQKEVIQNLLSCRAALFANVGNGSLVRPIMQYYRVNVVGAANKSKPTPVPAQIQNISSGQSPGDRRNYAYATGYAGNSHRTFKLKGLPSLWVPGDADLRYGEIAPTMKKNFEAYTKALVQGQFGMQVKNPADVRLNVTAARINDSGYLVLTVPGLVVDENDTINLRGMVGSGTKKLNGNMRITEKLTGSEFVTSKKKCDPCFFKPDNKGKVTKPTKVFAAFDSVEFTGWSSGKIGRAFFSEAGRLSPCCR